MGGMKKRKGEWSPVLAGVNLGEESGFEGRESNRGREIGESPSFGRSKLLRGGWEGRNGESGK